MHTEVPVKVNAYIDRGVAPLVLALNQFDDIVTVDSCEGQDDDPAYVWFTCRSGPENIFAFLLSLSGMLNARLADPSGYCLRLEWAPGAEHPLGEILSDQGRIDTLVDALRDAATSTRHSSL